jgi:hypothetical protein
LLSRRASSAAFAAAVARSCSACRAPSAASPELAVEGFDEAIIRWLAWPREVQHDALLVSPDIEIARDELRSLVDADGLGIANGFTDALQGQHDILASIAEAGIHSGREAAESIRDRSKIDINCFQ